MVTVAANPTTFVADGQRSGITPESLKNAAAASKQMPLEEAYKILGADSNAGIEEIMKVRSNSVQQLLHTGVNMG